MGFSLSSATGGLFGGSPSLKNFSTLSKNQKGVDSQLSNYFQSRVGKALPQYQGQMVAPLSAYEQTGLNQLQNYLGGTGAYMPQRQAAYATALGGQALAPIDMGASRDWFQNVVTPQYQSQFQQIAAPALEQARSMGAAPSSSAMNRALAEQAGNLSTYLGDMGYQYMLTEQQAQRDREAQNVALQMAAAAQSDPMRQEQLANVQASQQYGSLPRLLEQMQNDKGFQEFLRTQPEYSPVINQALNYISQSQQGTYMEGNPGVIGELTGGLNQVSQLGTAAINAMPSSWLVQSSLGQAAGNLLGSMYGGQR